MCILPTRKPRAVKILGDELERVTHFKYLGTSMEEEGGMGTEITKRLGACRLGIRWMCGVTRKDKIRNEHIRGTTRVAQVSKKITERRLNWYGHVMRTDGEHIGPLLRKVLRADIPGKRKIGRPETRWNDACQRYLKSTGLRAGEEMDKEMWRRKIISYTGDPT